MSQNEINTLITAFTNIFKHPLNRFRLVDYAGKMAMIDFLKSYYTLEKADKAKADEIIAEIADSFPQRIEVSFEKMEKAFEKENMQEATQWFHEWQTLVVYHAYMMETLADKGIVERVGRNYKLKMVESTGLEPVRP